MPLTTIAGPVTGLRIDTTTSTSININPQTGGGTATGTTTASTMHFRIANRPAFMQRAVNLTNSDLITAAGIQHNGEFEVIAFHNHTTGTLYWIPNLPLWICGIIIVVGVMTLGILVGWAILAVGIYYLVREGNKKKKAEEALRLVKNAPAPAVSPVTITSPA